MHGLYFNSSGASGGEIATAAPLPELLLAPPISHVDDNNWT
jgi:hypothetical protein